MSPDADLRQRVAEVRMAIKNVQRLKKKYPELLPSAISSHHRALLRYYDEVRKFRCKHSFVASHHVDIVSCTLCGKTETGDY